MTAAIPGVVALPGFITYTEISNRGELLEAAENIAGRATVAGALTSLTADLNRRLRILPMMVTTNLDTGVLPSDFLEAEVVKSARRDYRPHSLHGQPYGTFAVNGGELEMSPEEFPLTLTYYRRIEILEALEDTNDILADHPDLYLYGLLAHHGTLVRDEAGMAAWNPSYERTLQQVIEADAMARTSAVSMTPLNGYVCDN